MRIAVTIPNERTATNFMWCCTCHQDVPAVTNGVTGKLVCSRCQHPMSARRSTQATTIRDDGIALDSVGHADLGKAPPTFREDWSARRHVRELDRQIRRPILPTPGVSEIKLQSTRRFDPPQNVFEHGEHTPPPHIATNVTTTTSERLGSSRSDAGQLISWLVVLAGVAVSSTGVGLIYRSLLAGQTNYWNLAIGLAVGGQAALVLGLVMVVMHLWGNSRHAAGKLQDVHARLGHLQNTADALTATRAGGASAFYADLTRGASPQTLLANLKGQVDELAARLGNR